MSRQLPPLDLHAHVDVGVGARDLEGLGAVVFAATRSLDESAAALTRSDAVTVWGIGCHPGVPAAVDRFYVGLVLSPASADGIRQRGRPGRWVEGGHGQAGGGTLLRFWGSSQKRRALFRCTAPGRRRRHSTSLRNRRPRRHPPLVARKRGRDQAGHRSGAARSQSIQAWTWKGSRQPESGWSDCSQRPITPVEIVGAHRRSSLAGPVMLRPASAGSMGFLSAPFVSSSG